MSTENRKKVFRSSSINLAEWKCTADADAIERQRVLVQLNGALKTYADGRVINWYAHEVELQEDSSLYQIYYPGQILLTQLLQTSPVRSALSQERADDHNGLVRVTHDGKMEVRSDRGWVDLVAAGHFKYSSSSTDSIKLIADVARAAGGYIWPDSDITLDQWFKFHDVKPPENLASVKNLIEFFKFDPPVLEPSNYWEYIHSDDQTYATLSKEQLSAIRAVQPKLMGERKLLEVLNRVVGHAAGTHQNAARRINELFSHPESMRLARDYLKELGWFGVNEGQIVSQNTLRQLLITALLVELDPSLLNVQNRRSVGGYDLYAPTNAERQASIVREELTAFLWAKGWVDLDAPLIVHLLLARSAPEFLVMDVPPSVTLGSIAWIHFCRAVVIVETAKEGASRVLTYEQIMAYADLEPISNAQQHMRDLALIDPIVSWALINQVITQTELDQAEEACARRAIEAFEQHAEKFVQIARAFSTPLPSRANIAREALRIAAPGCDTLDEKALSEKGGQQVMSMVDLHQSGDLVTGKWDRRTVRLVTNGIPRPSINYNPSGISLFTRYPKLLQLKSCDEELDRRLAVHLVDLNAAMQSSVKLALAQMPESDLNAFLNAEINFFTVRESAVYIKKRRIGGPFEGEFPRETQQSRDAATGRFGLVMCASYNNAFICYELFTSRAEFRKNDALGALITREGKLNQASRMDFNASEKDHLNIIATQSLPLDVKRYTHATAQNTSVSSSMAIIDKFGTLPKPRTSSASKPGFYQKFNDPKVARIAEFIVQHRPFMHPKELRELVRIPTPLELSRDDGERLLTYFIDLVVPFKKCIEDIATGEHDAVVDGIYGCLMDGIGLIGTVAGASSKALSISAKAISTTSKAAKLTKLAFTSAVSLFNPLDGVPSGLQAGGRLVHKGWLRFNKNTHEIVAKANTQLHRLSGRRQSYDLIDASNCPPLGLGTWRPQGVAGEAVAVLAARSNNNKWYALNRRGNLWGQSLEGFAYQAPVQLPYSPKTLPTSYTRTFIEKSLPRARAKIDEAIATFSRHDFKRDREQVMKILFGDTSAVATERLVNYLRLIRFDFAGFSLSNIALDALKNPDALASFDVDSYKRWKNAGSITGSDIAFVEIYTQNLNKHFVKLGFNHDVVADDLIHELFHASAQTQDVGYAIDADYENHSGQRLDVAALLNLASGCLPVADADTVCHEASKAFENADSLGLATSLLSQLTTDKASYERNMMTISAALAASGGKAIVEPVIITLNKPR